MSLSNFTLLARAPGSGLCQELSLVLNMSDESSGLRGVVSWLRSVGSGERTDLTGEVSSV